MSAPGKRFDEMGYEERVILQESAYRETFKAVEIALPEYVEQGDRALNYGFRSGWDAALRATRENRA